MVDWVRELHPVVQALLAGGFTWALTALGAAGVLATDQVNRRLLDGMLGFAAGVMIAASFWSLLAPAIEMSRGTGVPVWLPAAAGFLMGGLCLSAVDRYLPHLHLGFPLEEAEGIPTSWHRSTLLVLAITLHNIPEGLAIGVALGGAAAGLPAASWEAALALTLGIGIQNFPEGLAVSVPLRREGFSRARSLCHGQASGFVEPLAAAVGAAVVHASRALLPYALAFAAGAMIFVVVEELVPESQREGNADLATLGALLGFASMMVLDIAFG